MYHHRRVQKDSMGEGIYNAVETEKLLDPPIPPPTNPDDEPGLDLLPGRGDPELPNLRSKA